MHFSAVLRSTATILLATIVDAVPHVADLGAATILTDNDLYGNYTTRTGSAILLQPSTFSVAEQRCSSLNEQLWSPLEFNFKDGLNASLAYTAFVNANNGTRMYWISTVSNATSCNAITTNGTFTTVPCNAIIPGLCTQSAPNSPANVSDISSKYQVSVKAGAQDITGFRDFHTFQFRGIRFAKQPERFTFSTLYTSSTPVKALEYGPGCIQGPDARFPVLSEDCLFLNILTPYLPSNSSTAAQRKKLKAVMFWIYGGGNTVGTGADPEKEGVNVASRGDVVVVTFNYRLGNLGFLPFNDGVHNGNYAISDMLTALQWVNKNIEAFGGDPKRVTIWGESAGAANVRALLATTAAKDLIAGAIMQSMPAEFGNQAGYARWEEPKDVYKTTTKKVLQESGCGNATDELACLRGYDAVRWSTEADKTVQIFPTRDGTLLHYRGLPLSGPLAEPHNIPILLGYNRDEVSYMIPLGPTNFTFILEQITNLVGINLIPLANSSFSPERSPSWNTSSDAEKANAVFDASGKVVTSGLFKCPTTAFAFSAEKNNIFNPVYQFEFNRTYQPARFEDSARGFCGRDVDDPEHMEYYKCHAGEVPFTFGNIVSQGWRDRDGLDTRFAQLIVDYWTAFARTGTMKPEDGYLEARGYDQSRSKMEEGGVWGQSDVGVMALQWGGLGLVELRDEQIGCKELGLAKDFYEHMDFGSS